MPQIKIIDPLAYPNWDSLLLSTTGYSFFHSSGWAMVLCESYRFKPLYFIKLSQDRLSALLPLMEAHTFFLGRKGISLPFSDHCFPVASNGPQLDRIIREAISHGKQAGWRYVEFRGDNSRTAHAPPHSSYYQHTLNLSQDHEDMMSRFRPNTRRNIKQAIKKKVDVGFFDSFDSIKQFYRLHCLTRKRHGVPPQPFYFFEKVFNRLISQGKGSVLLASYGAKTIAAMVFFHFGTQAMFKYGASDARHHALKPNNILMWRAIQWYAANNFTTLDFGRTDFSNMGLLRFKRGWGTTERILNYYRYDIRKQGFVENRLKPESVSPILRLFPSFLLRMMGRIFYKYAS